MKRPTSIFVVVQSGIYRHDIGPYAFTAEEAVELAKQRQLLERDSWHSFEVLELKAGSLEDGKVVAEVKGKYEWVDDLKNTYTMGGKSYIPKKEVRLEGFEVEYF
ncbi:hypothetical protein D3C85_830100 [compost metagenome]